jgi:hypothetical protein
MQTLWFFLDCLILMGEALRVSETSVTLEHLATSDIPKVLNFHQDRSK